MKKKWKWIIVIIVVLLCLRTCGSRTAKTVKPEPAPPTPSPTPAATATPTPAPVIEEEPAEPEETPQAEAPALTGIRPEFKAAMDSYEAFYNEYIDFLEEYYQNPADLSMLGRYTELLAKSEEMERSFDAWDESDMSNEEIIYYMEVTTRIEERMINLY